MRKIKPQRKRKNLTTELHGEHRGKNSHGDTELLYLIFIPISFYKKGLMIKQKGFELMLLLRETPCPPWLNILSIIFEEISIMQKGAKK
jgi:hypothetical protein